MAVMGMIFKYFILEEIKMMNKIFNNQLQMFLLEIEKKEVGNQLMGVRKRVKIMRIKLLMLKYILK